MKQLTELNNFLASIANLHARLIATNGGEKNRAHQEVLDRPLQKVRSADCRFGIAESGAVAFDA